MGCGSSKNVIDNSLQATNEPKANKRKEYSKNPNNELIKAVNALVLGSENTIINEDNIIENEAPVVNKKVEFQIGDRVHVRGYLGTVKFQGKTKLGEGQWIGIELDKPHPQGNNGAFQGITYFKCKPKHGLIVRPEAVFFHGENLENTLSNVSPETVVFIQNKLRRLLAKIRLKKLQERSGNEKVIDKHVMNAPKAEEESPNRLGIYLTKPFSRSRDKAFAIYRWLTLNIAYDVDGFFGRNSKKSCTAEDVLSSKLSVCAGYANLFEAMGKAADLEVSVVSGYAKGYGHQPGQRVEGTNHAWNALRIDNQWYLSDATWGAGYVGSDMMFHREPNTYRFLMDPEFAILDHLPEENKWQFLDQPVSTETFANSAVMSGAMYDMGIELLSHEQLQYNISDDSIEMTFYCPGKKILLKGNIKGHSGQDLSDGRERVQIRPCGINQVKLCAQFPAPGTYKIDIYVKTEHSWTHGTSYFVKTIKGCGNGKKGFPQISGSFFDNGFDIISPLTNVKSNNGKAQIRLESYSQRFHSVYGNILGVTDKEKSKVKNQCLCYTLATKNGYLIMVDTPGPGDYILNIFAKQDGGKSLYLCKYHITNTETAKRDITGFPRLSDDFHSLKLELVEPQENIITSDGRANVNIKGPDLTKMSFNCNLQPDNDTNLELEPNQQLCYCQVSNDAVTIKIDTPIKGLYTLNVFGGKEQIKQTWLCTYKIYSKSTVERPVFGFPRLSNEFKCWGLVLVEPRENIHSKDGNAQIIVKCPEAVTDLLCNLKKKQTGFDKCCSVTSYDDKRVISIKFPSEGLFNLNVFGKKEGEDNFTYLLSYLIKSEGSSQ